ncbi:MAG: hypothetical protein M1829_000165 [Trizodia sp. TS-e1964]|nr:MAG: hypothetical protein M1829_000165 [Trizodia sp. TS-e1964]
MLDPSIDLKSLRIRRSKDTRILEKTPEAYFVKGVKLMTVEIIQSHILYLAVGSTRVFDDNITLNTAWLYISNTFTAAYHATGGIRQIGKEELPDVYHYINHLASIGGLSTRTRYKPVAIAQDVVVLIEELFSNAYAFTRKGVRPILTLALYINLFIDTCARGSDLALGGHSISKQTNECLC